MSGQKRFNEYSAGAGSENTAPLVMAQFMQLVSNLRPALTTPNSEADGVVAQNGGVNTNEAGELAYSGYQQAYAGNQEVIPAYEQRYSEYAQMGYEAQQNNVDPCDLLDFDFLVGNEVEEAIRQFEADKVVDATSKTAVAQVNNVDGTEAAIFAVEYGVVAKDAGEPLLEMPQLKTPAPQTAAVDSEEEFETWPRRASTSSSKSTGSKVPHSGGVVEGNGGSKKTKRVRGEVEVTPSKSHKQTRKSKAPPKRKLTELEKLLTREKSQSAQQKEAGPSKKSKKEAGKRQTTKISTLVTRNVGPIVDKVATKAGCSGATLPTSVEEQISIVNVIDSSSESEFEVFSQAEDRELFKKFSERCRRLDEELQVHTINIESEERLIQREEENRRNAQENIERLERELRRFQEEDLRAEKEIGRLKESKKKNQLALNAVVKKRALVRKMCLS